MIDENEDGVFEPNTLIRVRDVRWTNIGALTMPATSVITFPSTPSVFSMGHKEILPACNVNQHLVVEAKEQKEFLLRLPDAAPVNGLAPHKREHTFSSTIKLLGRAFPASIVPTTLISRYPIEFSAVTVTPILGPGEISAFNFTITNISNGEYGADCLGSIVAVIWCDSNLNIHPPTSAADNYVLTQNGCLVSVPRLASKASVNISIKFTCSMAVRACELVLMCSY